MTSKLFEFSKTLMPKISETERVALGAGTIGFDRDIFTGSPSLQHLIDTYEPKLSSEEQSFLDVECQELCEMLSDHEIVENKDMDAASWEYIRDSGFFAMKIPKEFGGKGFSTAAVSAVLCKVGSQSFDASCVIAVPNSLGPGELLGRYGTEGQKDYFMPKLADGTLVPCFGLTGIHSGSDATSLIGSDGIVEERDGVLGIKMSFDKRYITLAPVAGVVGIGFDLQDPDNLLQGDGCGGFTVALLERDHEGLEMGPRHMPLAAAFPNGTVKGKDVWVTMDQILGGQKRCGYGWHMFVECLAEGRGVSLPAAAIAAGCLTSTAVGSYARVRKQFKVPIADFGGIKEVLARATSNTLMCVAGGDLMNAIVDNHEAPMIISSIMKQNTTDRGREIVKDGMDILGGAGICRGDMNFLGNSYMNFPIVITVEGANIMTRSFQIIGQGITRCHPHMIPLIDSLQSDAPEAADQFGTEFGNMASHGARNLWQSISRGIKSSAETKMRNGDTAHSNVDALIAYHENQLLRLSANFALSADLALLNGGKLKFQEQLMGRLADAMGAIYLGYSVLHFQHRHREVEGLTAVTEHAMQMLEHEAHEALRLAAENYPTPLPGMAGAAVRGFASGMAGFATAPLGGFTRPYRPPSDVLTKTVSDLMTNPTAVHELFKQNTFTTDKKVHRVTRLYEAMPVCVAADEVAKTLRKEKRDPTEEEAAVQAAADAWRDELVMVDTVEKYGTMENSPGYERPALAGTRARLEAAASAAATSSPLSGDAAEPQGASNESKETVA